jgi:hypothetical protein
MAAVERGEKRVAVLPSSSSSPAGRAADASAEAEIEPVAGPNLPSANIGAVVVADWKVFFFATRRDTSGGRQGKPNRRFVVLSSYVSCSNKCTSNYWNTVPG